MSVFRKPYPALPVLFGAFLTGALSPSANSSAEENPFKSIHLHAGYMIAADETAKDTQGKCGEGKCGAKSDKEAVCGIYTVGSAHKDDSKVKDGKCGGHKVVEALCGGDL
jgi:uncharacterized low-complexity protein